MEEMTLEKEFVFYRMQHMCDILFIRLVNFYQDFQNTGVKLPDFMQENPEVLAKKELDNILVCTDRQQFYNLYEQAYNDIVVDA